MPRSFYVGVKGLIQTELGVLQLRKVHPDRWELPGGRIELNETVDMTLKRELEEELPGIKHIFMGKLLSVEVIDSTDKYEHGLTLITYQVVCKLPMEIKLSEEHSEYRWV